MKDSTKYFETIMAFHKVMDQCNFECNISGAAGDLCHKRLAEMIIAQEDFERSLKTTLQKFI